MNTVEVIKTGNTYTCTFDDLKITTSDRREVVEEFNAKFDLEYEFEDIIELSNSLNTPSPLNSLFTAAVKPKVVEQHVPRETEPQPVDSKPEIKATQETVVETELQIKPEITKEPIMTAPEVTKEITPEVKQDPIQELPEVMPQIKIKPQFKLSFDGDRFICSFNKKESKPREESGVVTAYYKATGRQYDCDQIAAICDGTIEFPDREHTTDPSVKYDNLTDLYYVKFSGKENKRGMTQDGVVRLFNKTYKRKFDYDQIEKYIAGEMQIESKLPHGTATVFTEKKELVNREAKNKFDINKRFDFLEKTLGMIADGIQNSVVVTGRGGTGKSHTAIKTLEKYGYINHADITPVEIEEPEDIEEIEGNEKITIDKSNTFIQIKGFSTAKGLYRALYENNGAIILLDDLDDALQNGTSLNLLKGALDSYDRRIISWNADMKDDDLPRRFEFTGRIIFISNKSLSSIDQAIRSRSMCIDLEMSPEQTVERMRHIANTADFMPQFPLEYKLDAINLIDEFKYRAKDVSLRDLMQITRIRSSGAEDWHEMAEYILTA